MWSDRSRILVIDDDPCDRLVVHRWIDDRHEVLDAATGEEGLAIVSSAAPQCVLLDYQLPDVDGLEVLDVLVRNESHDTAVVMLSGQGNEQVAVEAMKRGADDYLCKGALNRDSLLRAIANSMEKRVLRRKIQAQQRQLEKYTRALETSNRDLEQFASVASHDLQEPLRVVRSYCELIEASYADRLDEQARRWLHWASDGCRRMKEMIDDLLQYSRVESRGRPLAMTDAGVACDEAVANLDAAIRESAAVVIREALPRLTADHAQLRQLFQNLIGNAIKYRGANPPRVEVTAREDDGHWRFQVRDNGIGIDPKQFERVFQLFYRLHPRGEYPGNGIGLAVCERIVRRHGGCIGVDSEPGRGSTFWFVIPRATRNDSSNSLFDSDAKTCRQPVPSETETSKRRCTTEIGAAKSTNELQPR